ncbi:MAG: helix-turn-helix transcriptional regulator [Candidatus Humimicrobiia bacterium]
MANAIKYWRNKRNMTQQKLADLIGIDKEINFITNKILRKIGFDKLPEGIKK